ncbi:hypothetical protein PoB_000093800 [Plakobranchus ocellatus]|uniref:Uncharacterized protein n=1 Tax=Plakobranchus ocellatus TaxID=259542 RepID=A0AAV3XVP9_9GAST|nr:hypothetical protein PoB_000093800 [Plakobranchus ocellatus]
MFDRVHVGCYCWPGMDDTNLLSCEVSLWSPWHDGLGRCPAVKCSLDGYVLKVPHVATRYCYIVGAISRCWNMHQCCPVVCCDSAPHRHLPISSVRVFMYTLVPKPFTSTVYIRIRPSLRPRTNLDSSLKKT